MDFATDQSVITKDAPQNVASPILEVKHLKKSFGDLHVLKDISFDLKAGEVLSIIGPSGSGKSTLLRCLTQLETFEAGEVRVDGKDMVVPGVSAKGPAVKYAPAKTLRDIRLSTGLVFQNFNLFPHLTVLQNLTLAPIRVLHASREESRALGLHLLKQMGLEGKEKAYPCELSGGQQQRVSIARALALKPKILFFDEPTSALDPELTGEVLKIIKKLAEDKMTMVIVTHEMAFARDVADKVIFMDGGVIVEQGTPDHVFRESGNERLVQFLSRFTNA
ncbi:MAG: amino acid ABC transporter ATP-binding protein [Fibrobacter sp.]|nr:amino acid ABC transporter ATP-binding protein [Fibrobacter sp.]